MGRYELTVGGYFEAALRVPGAGQKADALHGRRFDVEVSFAGEKLNRLGMLADERKLRAALAQALSEFDHSYLNELPEFVGANPTAENIARLICERMQPAAGDCGLTVSEVSVRLHPGARVSYRP